MKQNRNHEYHAEKATKLSRLYEVIGYPLNDEKIALQAITCSNFAKEYNDCSSDKIYEHDGLAVVGDAILKSVLSIDVFLSDQTITEGDLTNQKKAIENNEFQNLPSLIYLRNFLKSYAEILHLDPEKVADSYIINISLLQK